MLVVAALLLLVGLTAFDNLGPRALATMLLPAIVFLVAVPMIGPMPDPCGPTVSEQVRGRDAR